MSMLFAYINQVIGWFVWLAAHFVEHCLLSHFFFGHLEQSPTALTSHFYAMRGK